MLGEASERTGEVPLEKHRARVRTGRRGGAGGAPCKRIRQDTYMIHDSTVAPHSQSPYVANDTFKLTRALWWALYAPDSGRHEALLVDDLPDPYRTLFDAILDGSRGLARVAVSGGDALDLLDVVAKLPRPRAIPTRRLELPDNPDLAAALFGRLADDLEIGAAGVGEWPGMPSHTCGAGQAVGTVITSRPKRTQAARMFNPTWRTCPACHYQRAKRIARQTLITIAAVKKPMTYATLSAADWGKWTARNRQHKHRRGDAVHYRAMPQEGGDVFVMATAGLAGQPVPVDRRELLELIRDHCLTPEGQNVSSNRGFGGSFQRMKGDGRDNDPEPIRGLRAEVDRLRLDLSQRRMDAARAKAKVRRLQIEERRRIAGELAYWWGGEWPQSAAAEELSGLLYDELMRRLQRLNLAKATAAIEAHRAAESIVATAAAQVADARNRLETAIRQRPRDYVQRWTNSDIVDVARALSVDMREDADRFNVQIDQTDALERLHLGGIVLRDKKRVTHLGQNAQGGKNCPKCVTSPPAEERPAPLIAPQLWPTESATAGQGVQQ